MDESGDASNYILTALLIPSVQWKTTFEKIKEFRKEMKSRLGLFTSKEWYATDFVAGRGRIAPKDITKFERSQIFKNVLILLSSIQGIQIINVCGKKKDIPDTEGWAYDRMFNRIQTFLSKNKSYGVIVCDRGKEARVTKICRKMKVFNPIPSKYGKWSGGAATKNIPTELLIDDPFFKDSSQSYLLQVVDFCAFALAKKESPTPHSKKYGIHKMFDLLDPILCKEASSSDPRGIVKK